MNTETWEPQPKGTSPWRKLFRRRRKFDRNALPELLATPPAQNADAIPFTLKFGSGEALGAVAGHVFMLLMLTLAYVLVFDKPIFIALSVLGIALSFLATQVPDFPIRYSSVTVSGEGVRLTRRFRDDLVLRWWDVRSIFASRDISRVQLKCTRSVVLPMPRSDPAANFVQALRAHGAAHSLEVQEWPGRKQVLRRASPVALHLASFATIAVAAYLAAPGALGMRCSANSAYMQRTSGTPERTGCVVLRVSAGAAKAGVHKGDLMIEMNGVPVTSGQQFSTVFDATSPPWRITVIRRGVSEPLEFMIHPAPSWNFSSEPNDAIHYYLRARGEAADDPNVAIKDYTNVIDREPDFDLAYLYRGQLFEDAGRVEDARSDYEKAIALSPGLGETTSIYANFQFAHGDWNEGMDEIKTALRKDQCQGAFQGLNVDCAYDYAVLALLDEYAFFDQMRDAAEQSISFYGGRAFPYYLAACAHNRLGEAGQAEQRARDYLAFPASERRDTETSAMEALSTGTQC